MARPVLQNYSEDEAVFELQDLLNRVGALLVEDGKFGKGTERAVKEAQEMAGLPVTGVADQATWDWLEAQPLPSPDLSTSDVTFVVREEVGSRDYYEKVGFGVTLISPFNGIAPIPNQRYHRLQTENIISKSRSPK